MIAEWTLLAENLFAWSWPQSQLDEPHSHLDESGCPKSPTGILAERIEKFKCVEAVLDGLVTGN